MTASNNSHAARSLPREYPHFDVLLKYKTEFVVINKPYDVRIDGDFPVTVKRHLEESPEFAEFFKDTDEEAALRKRHKSCAPERSVHFAHRLDYATSGILCISFTKKMTSKLGQVFASRTTEKHYLAVCRGHISPSNNTFRIDAPIARDPTDERGFRMCIGGTPENPGKPASTEGRVLSRGYYNGHPVTKVMLKLITGRTHQLRLHMRHIGHPILGDATYNNDSEPPRMFLHAWKLTIPPLEKDGEPILIQTEDPFANVIEEEDEEQQQQQQQQSCDEETTITTTTTAAAAATNYRPTS